MVFGHTDGFGAQKVHCLNLESLVWSQVHCTGAAPPVSYQHSVAVFGNTLVSFFGRTPGDYDAENVQGIWALCCSSWTWTDWSANAMPMTRSAASCTSTSNGYFVFGGYSLDTECCLDDAYFLKYSSDAGPCFHAAAMAGDAPAPRRAHSAAAVGSRVLIFGGCTSQGNESCALVPHNDLIVADLEDNQWCRPHIGGCRCPNIFQMCL